MRAHVQVPLVVALGLAVLSAALIGSADALDSLGRRHMRLRMKALQAHGHERWEDLPDIYPNSFGKTTATDGETFWLREYYFRAKDDSKCVTIGRAGDQKLLVGDAFGSRRSAVLLIALDPAVDPLTTKTNLDLGKWSGVSSTWQTWIETHANTIKGFGDGSTDAGLSGDSDFTGCDPALLNALAAYGTTKSLSSGSGSTNKRAALGTLNALGSLTKCDLDVPLATLKAWAALIDAGTPEQDVSQWTSFVKFADATALDLNKWFDLLGTAQMTREWIYQNRVKLAGLKVVGSNGAAVNALITTTAITEVTGCDRTLVNAFLSHGKTLGTSNPKAELLAGLNDIGTRTSCDLNVPLAKLQLWLPHMTAASIVTPWQALKDHYSRFQHLLDDTFKATTNFDIWSLRGWLYATDRSKGHRLIGAAGWAVDVGGPAPLGWENQMLQTKTHGGATTYGLSKDTAGHVRPRSLGGMRDPLNFVPQSNVGQKMVQPAEMLALQLVKSCTSGSKVRYTVVYSYKSDDARRPIKARSVVDLTAADCPDDSRLGAVKIKIQDSLFDKEFNTY